MTKHDYQKALNDVNELWGFSEIPGTCIIPDSLLPTIRHALKLAAIVTGEPSEEMTIAGCEVWKKHPMAVVTQFKAMIAAAQREISEDGRG